MFDRDEPRFEGMMTYEAPVLQGRGLAACGGRIKSNGMRVSEEAHHCAEAAWEIDMNNFRRRSDMLVTWLLCLLG